MKLIHRVAYYLGGFAIGLVILFFFLSGKRTSCDYGPDARVLKNIRIKNLQYSEDALVFLESTGLDTSFVNGALKYGDVNFSESKTNKDSCNIYVIEYEFEDRDISFNAENCKETATLSHFKEID